MGRSYINIVDVDLKNLGWEMLLYQMIGLWGSAEQDL